MLQSHEMRLDQLQASISIDLTNASANVAYNSQTHNSSRGSQGGTDQGFQRGRSGNYRGDCGSQRGGGRGRNGSQRPVCQICRKVGHMATTCWFRFDNEFQSSAKSSQGNRVNNGLKSSAAHIATLDTVYDSSWYMDSGATSHVTLELDNLSLSSDYKGKAKLCVGDGNALTISHIGSFLLSSKN